LAFKFKLRREEKHTPRPGENDGSYQDGKLGLRAGGGDDDFVSNL
jgi:hypothetical protein